MLLPPPSDCLATTAISIAVIHHLSSEARRVAAVQVLRRPHAPSSFHPFPPPCPSYCKSPPVNESEGAKRASRPAEWCAQRMPQVFECASEAQDLLHNARHVSCSKRVLLSRPATAALPGSRQSRGRRLFETVLGLFAWWRLGAGDSAHLKAGRAHAPVQLGLRADWPPQRFPPHTCSFICTCTRVRMSLYVLSTCSFWRARAPRDCHAGPVARQETSRGWVSGSVGHVVGEGNSPLPMW